MQTLLNSLNEKLIENENADGIKISNSKTPAFYSIPKIYKPNNPRRQMLNLIECHA